MESNLDTLILAAGLGTRMKSDIVTVAEGAIINGAITMKESGALGQVVRPAEKKPEIAHAPVPAPAPAAQKIN